MSIIDEEVKERNPFWRIIELLAGTTGLVAFFLPFFKIQKEFINSSISGYKLSLEIYNLITSLINQNFTELQSMIGEIFKQILLDSEGTNRIIFLFGAIFISLAPLVFIYFSIRMIFSSIFARRAYSGLRYAIFYTAVCWGIFYWVSQEFNEIITFFDFTHWGYYLSIAACVLSGLARFLSRPRKF